MREIKDALVAQFAVVLAEPPAGGFGLLAWLLPLAGWPAGRSRIGVLLRRWSRRATDRPPERAPRPELERLVDDGSRLDG